MLRNVLSMFARIRRSMPTRNTSAPASQDPNYMTEPCLVNVLPPELLDDVFKLLNRSTLLTCMQVCRRWYGIASPHFLAVIPVTHRHFKRLSKYLRAHLDLAVHVKDVYLFERPCGDSWRLRSIPRSPLDVRLLASTLPTLTSLQNLRLVGYDSVLDSSLANRSSLGRPSARTSLQLLSFHHCKDAVAMLPDLLSLFSINTLVIVHLQSRLYPLESPPRIPPSTLQESIPIQNLVLGESAEYLEGLYTFFERALVPGSLRALGTGRWNHRDLPILERFLRSSAARDLVSISIGVVFGAYSLPRQAGVTVPTHNAGPTVCDMLGAALAHCTRLQYLRLGFVHVNDDDRSDPLNCQHNAFMPILESLPTTLRALAIHIWLNVPQLWCCISPTLGLDAVDRMLAPDPSSGGGEGGGRRFPDLRRVELHVHQNLTVSRGTCVQPLGEHDPRVPLPRIQAAGLLLYRPGDMEFDQPRVYPATGVYWPPDV